MLGIWSFPDTGTDPPITPIGPKFDPRYVHQVFVVPSPSPDPPNMKCRDIRPANIGSMAGRIPFALGTLQPNDLQSQLGRTFGIAQVLRPITPQPRPVNITVTYATGLQSPHGPSPKPTPISEPSYYAPGCNTL